ncbi:MAG TPA: NAD(P)/FAD-dependent oxidoreductase [Solirubrobacteraceae bacterium]|jgi:phytoene dehydrogenase-like protein
MATVDAIIVGAGHNGLVAATLLARAGRRVLVLERAAHPGGAAVSSAPFAGVDARISRYAYLVSLFPSRLLSDLGIEVEMRRRSVSSYTPLGDAGVLVCDDEERTRESITRTLGDDRAATDIERFGAMTAAVAQRVFPTLTEPLLSREAFRRRLGDEQAWRALFEHPLSQVLEDAIDSDLARGIVATDALIGTFADTADPQLRQNRCFLYHVIGNGTGRWDVPVGGMGALSTALAHAAQQAGAEIRLNAPVVSIQADSHGVEVTTAEGNRHAGRHLLANVAPSVLAGLRGDPPPALAPEGSQLKLNLLLSKLPRLRDESLTREEAFAGTFHVNESYEQLRAAYAQAAAGAIPALPPCEAYCHTLTDASILGPELRASAVHTLTVFVLHMPARLFRLDHEEAKRAAVAATLRSLDSVLAEPIEGCLLRTPTGAACLEAHTPIELEAELGLPGGHIFHRDLSWPYAESEHEIGRWGVETARPNVWICGAGARRGGAVSGIPGHNAAHAVIEADARRAPRTAERSL